MWGKVWQRKDGTWVFSFFPYDMTEFSVNSKEEADAILEASYDAMMERDWHNSCD